MRRLAYLKVANTDQSIESQKATMTSEYRRVFIDEGNSWSLKAADRPGFGDLLKFVDRGDMVCVYSLYRLGKDASDIQNTIKDLTDRGVSIDVHGLGPIVGYLGRIIHALLAQAAGMEREKLLDKEVEASSTDDPREQAGEPQKAREGIGRPMAADREQVKAWRASNNASLSATASHFEISLATVKRYCAAPN